VASPEKKNRKGGKGEEDLKNPPGKKKGESGVEGDQAAFKSH